MATPEVHQLTLYGRDGAGNQWNCVLHYLLSSSGTWVGEPIDRSVALLTAFAAIVETLWSQAMPLNYFVDLLTAKRVTPGVGFTSTYVAGWTNTSNLEASSLVQGPLFRWIPFDPYPRAGRMFFPGIPEDVVTDGHIAPTFITGVLTPLGHGLADSFTWTTSTDSGGAKLCVYNRVSHANGLVHDFEIAQKLGVLGKRLKPVY